MKRNKIIKKFNNIVENVSIGLGETHLENLHPDTEFEEAFEFLEDTPEINHRLRGPLAKKLGEILKLGKLPSRGNEEYGKFCAHINCLAHACFNLPNSLIELLDLDSVRYEFKNPFSSFGCTSVTDTKTEMIDFLEETGLIVEESDTQKILKDNQRRVALYFSEGFEDERKGKDFHFLLQGEDGSWSGKRGGSSRCSDFSKGLPTTLPFYLANRYKLDSVLVLTNPYASAKNALAREEKIK